MLEEILVQLAIHLGKRLIDGVGRPRDASSTPVSPSGRVLDTASSIATPAASGSPLRRPGYERLRATFVVQKKIREGIRGHQRAFLILQDKKTQELAVVGPLSLEQGYEIDIVAGTYSMYVAVIDFTANKRSNPVIQGVGFPYSQHQARLFSVDTPDRLWSVIDRSPRVVSKNAGPYNIPFAVVAVADLPGRPAPSADVAVSYDHVIPDDQGRVWRPEAGYEWLNPLSAEAGDLRVKWQPGVEHPDYDHVIADAEEGVWATESGYKWVSQRKADAGDYRVRWQPGVEHPDYDHVIADDEEGVWTAEAGYIWMSERKTDFRVKWEPGVEHPDYDHVIADAEEGVWATESGYKWVSQRKADAGDLRVKWQPRVEHPDYDHVFTDDDEGVWVAEAGYGWVSQRRADAGDLRVKWRPGTRHPDFDHVIADHEEGVWKPEEGYDWVNWRLAKTGDLRVQWKSS